MEELSNLRQLYLSHTKCLKTVEAGVISSLSSLEVLDMTESSYKWGVKGDVEKGQTMFEELGCLERLAAVCICLKSTPYLGREDLIWIERWKSFKIMVRTLGLVMSLSNVSGNRIRWLLINVSNLELRSCMQIGSMFEDLAHNGEGFAGLRSMCIQNCDIFEPDIECAAGLDLPPNLEQLFLDSIRNVDCLCPLPAPLGLTFSRLRVFEVCRCQELRYIIPHHLISYLINLEQIKVSDCLNLEGLFEYCMSGQTVTPDQIVQLRFSRLRVINVSDCRQLKYLIHHDRISCLINLEEIKVSGCSSLGKLFEYKSKKNVAPHPVVPRLQILEVFGCNQLRRLPLTTRNANTLKVIRGTKWWWNQLEWDDDDTKLTLLPFFQTQ